MGVRRLQTEIDLAELEEAFAVAEEDLNEDLSVIRISMTRDVHYDSIELSVLIFGKDDAEGDAPVAEFWIDPLVVGSEDELNNEGIEPCRLRAIFSQTILNLIVEKDTSIQWLCENESILMLSLSLLDNNGIRLLPIDQ